jgi:hypothetical protein
MLEGTRTDTVDEAPLDLRWIICPWTFYPLRMIEQPIQYWVWIEIKLG